MLKGRVQLGAIMTLLKSKWRLQDEKIRSISFALSGRGNNNLSNSPTNVISGKRVSKAFIAITSSQSSIDSNENFLLSRKSK